MPAPPQTLTLLAGRFAVCRLPPGTELAPLWGELSSEPHGEVLAVVRTRDELSLVCAEERAPPTARVERGWRCLAVRGPIPFATVGVVAGLAAPLAQAGVALFVVSTFDTDYVLVKEAELGRACRALLGSGHAVVQ